MALNVAWLSALMRWVRGRDLEIAMERNRAAAARLDAAVREVTKR